jgi:pSer/pThr/pTyr-binding forkhead associated (FHA) protein
LSVQFPSGEVYELSGKRTFLVGRRDASSGMHPDLDLTAEGGVEAGVSRGHAAIHLRAEGYFIEDLGSANETLLNFQRLLPRQLYPLHSGDQVRFGLLNALVVIAE